MIRLTPSHAITDGSLYFRKVFPLRNPETVVVRATLDSYHNDLRFEFEDIILYYNLDSLTFVYDSYNIPKTISGFFRQKVQDDNVEVTFFSFVFEIGYQDDLRIFNVHGYFEEDVPESEEAAYALSGCCISSVRTH